MVATMIVVRNKRTGEWWGGAGHLGSRWSRKAPKVYETLAAANQAVAAANMKRRTIRRKDIIDDHCFVFSRTPVDAVVADSHEVVTLIDRTSEAVTAPLEYLRAHNRRLLEQRDRLQEDVARLEDNESSPDTEALRVENVALAADLSALEARLAVAQEAIPDAHLVDELATVLGVGVSRRLAVQHAITTTILLGKGRMR